MLSAYQTRLNIIICFTMLAAMLTSCVIMPKEASPTSLTEVGLTTLTSAPPTSTSAASPEPTATNTAAPTATPLVPGLILYESHNENGMAIWQMNGDGTGAHVVVPYDPEEGGFGLYPRWSPDGRHFAYLYHETPGDEKWDSVWIAERDGSHAYRVGERESSAAASWADANTLGYYNVRDSTPYSYTYHLDTGALSVGSPFPKVAGIDPYSQDCSPGCNKLAATKDKRELFIVDSHTGEQKRVYAVDESDEERTLSSYGWSPDGQYLAFGDFQLLNYQPLADLYVVDVAGQDVRRLTNFEAEYEGPASPTAVSNVVWSPDGEWLAFLIGTGWDSYVGVIPAAGGAPKNLGCGPLKAITDPVWSPDSTKLAFVCNQRFENGRFEPVNDQWDLYTVDIRTAEIQRLTKDEAMEMHIDWR